jgi:predicted small secreted protein
MKKLIAVLIAGLFLAGCNTIEGVGKDIKKGGEVIEKTAEKAK